VPAVQALQKVAATATVPAAHLSQTDKPGNVLKLPAGQAAQKPAPAAE